MSPCKKNRIANRNIIRSWTFCIDTSWQLSASWGRNKRAKVGKRLERHVDSCFNKRIGRRNKFNRQKDISWDSGGAGRDAFYGIMGRVLEYAGTSGGIAVRSGGEKERKRERE